MIEIKKANIGDAGKISILRRDTIKKINKKDYSEKIMCFLIKRDSIENVKRKIKEGKIFCAYSKNKLIGTVSLKGDYISGLYVKSSEIGKGIGRELMQFVETYARDRKLKKVRLTPTPFAFKFYKKLGYQVVGFKEWEIEGSKMKVKAMEKRL